MALIAIIERTHSVESVSEELQRRGIDAFEVRFPRQTVLVVANARPDRGSERELAKISGVERIVEVRESYRLVHRSFRPEGTCVDLGGGAAIGRGRFAVLGDLAADVETDALARAADCLAQGRAAALIATLPQDDRPSRCPKRLAAIEALEKIRSATGLRIGIEVVSDDDLNDCAQLADLLRLGAERMQDYRFLQRVGAIGKPVVLVRALSATLEEWLLAAEYLAATGNDQVILCECGIRSFVPETGRITLDLASVARLSEMTHLPVIVDPFRGGGSVSLGARLARAAVAAGADGIVFPLVHGQAAKEPGLPAEGLAALLASLGPMLAAEGKRLRRASRVASPA